jgi:hypothetical protein
MHHVLLYILGLHIIIHSICYLQPALQPRHHSRPKGSLPPRVLDTLHLEELLSARVQVDGGRIDPARALENFPASEVQGEDGEADVFEHESAGLEAGDESVVSWV